MAKEVESRRPRLKLTAAATIDYPSASEILVTFPDEWELVEQIIRGEEALYIATMPDSQERPRRDQFHGLPPEINLDMTAYRLYKFFRPWPMPSIIASWDERAQTGRVEGEGDLKVQLQALGQAQVWLGTNCGVLWECYFFDQERRRSDWEGRLAMVWQIVGKDVGVPKLYTQPHDPAFEEGYQDFLRRLGYAPDAAHPTWWSKSS